MNWFTLHIATGDMDAYRGNHRGHVK